LACFGFIRPTLGFSKRQPWGKCEVPTLAVILQFRFHLLHLCIDYKLWPFAPIRGVSCNIHRASYYRDQADHARRLARAHIQDETKAPLRIVVQDYDNIAEDPENGAVVIFHPEMLPQP